MRASLLLWLALGCGTARGDGAARLPFGTDLPLAFGAQRLLVLLPPDRAVRVRLTPLPGDFASLSASICKLDPHQRIDEGDHCLGQAVAVAPDGASEVSIAGPREEGAPRDVHFNGVALQIRSVGTSPGPVTLRLDAL